MYFAFMPRKSLAGERTEQILDAFERCVVKYGLEGSSLEKIGEEAGMKRTILRHYIGNRKDLIHALCDRVVERWEWQLAHLKKTPFAEGEGKKFVDYLFLSGKETGDSILVAESLIASAEMFPEVGESMKESISNYTKVLSEHLKKITPRATPQNCWQVAYGILAIIFNEVSLVTLHLPPKFQQASRKAALRLVESL